MNGCDVLPNLLDLLPINEENYLIVRRLLSHTSINLDRIWGWIHRNPDRNAGSSLEASSVLTRFSSLQNTKNHVTSHTGILSD